MAKRMTDTDKWKHPWFRKLPPEHKLLWQYILDNCNHGGIWHKDEELAEFQIGNQYDWQEVRFLFKEKFFEADSDKWFIFSFIEFQYGKMNPASKVHQSVIRILENAGVMEIYRSWESTLPRINNEEINPETQVPQYPDSF